MQDKFKDTAEEDKDTGTSDGTNYQGTSNGVSGDRNTTHKVVFVDNLPSTMDKNGFIQLFRRYGIIVDVKFLKHKTGAETGYGFVEFADWEDGRKAISDLNWTLVDNRHIRVSRAKPPTKKVSQTNLYVKNVPNNWNDLTLRQYFSRICQITQARILVNRKNGQSRGVGFVHCLNNDEAKNAIQHINADQHVNLEAKFAKISRAERKILRQREGGCGSQERRKQIQRGFHGQNVFQDQYQGLINEDGRENLRGGSNHYNQYSFHGEGRDSKSNRKKNQRNKFDKRYFKGSKKHSNATRDVDEKDHCKYSSRQSPLETSQSSSALSLPNLPQVPSLGITTTEQSSPFVNNDGFSQKANQSSPVLQVQIPTGNSRSVRDNEHKFTLYQKAQTPQNPKTGYCRSMDAKNSQLYLRNGTFPKGVTGGVIYPNNFTPVASNQTFQFPDLTTTSPYPYPWSPTLVTPAVRTPGGVSSPVPFYNFVGSPGNTPGDYGSVSTQITSPRAANDRQTFRYPNAVSPDGVNCSEMQTPNNNISFWSVSPNRSTAPTVTTPFTLPQQMSNISTNDETSYHMGWSWKEREPGSIRNPVAFPGPKPDVVTTPRNAVTDNRAGGGGGVAGDDWANYSKFRQYAKTENRLEEAVTSISNPISPRGWGLPSFFGTQPFPMPPTQAHFQTQSMSVPQSVVRSNLYNQSMVGVTPFNAAEQRGRPKYGENTIFQAGRLNCQ